jgi:hypothetical protein
MPNLLGRQLERDALELTAVGGQLEVQSPESGGTLLSAKLPVLAS